MSILRWSVPTICCLVAGLSQLDGRSTHLVIDDTLLSAIRDKLPAGFEAIPKSGLDPVRSQNRIPQRRDIIRR